MQELKDQLMAKLGIDEAKATHAIQTVMDYLKDKLPAQLHTAIDSAMHGGGTGGLLEEAKTVLGGFFHKDQNA